MNSTVQSGFFGKLPVLGDFLTRRLSVDFVGPWDRWLQQGLTAAREQLSGGWTDSYRRAAPWRFALESGACGPRALLGVMNFSWDRVGRQFPLTIAFELPAGCSAFEVASCAEAWYLAAEKLSGQAITEEMALETFDAAVVQLAPLLRAGLSVPAAADLSACEQYLRADGAFRLPLLSQGLGCSLTAMCAAQLARSAPPVAAFWCEATSGEPILYASRGLPAPTLWGEWLQLARRALPPDTITAVAPIPTPSLSPSPVSELTMPRGASAIRWQHTLLSAATPGAALAIAAIPVELEAQVAERLAEVGALLQQWNALGDEMFEKLAVLVRAPQGSPQAPHQASIHLAACLPQGPGHVFAWSGAAAIFRLRGRKLERLTADSEATAKGEGGSLLDLLQSSDAEASPHEAIELKLSHVDTTELQDRYLLCADATYASLSWGQLVSALAESSPEYAAARLREAVGQRIESAVPALIVMFEGSQDAPSVRVANTLEVVPDVAAS
jgi:type VI secretion system protein ImpM